ncbi:MAG: DUF2934 domain-containing protein [Bryobacteraceae bacterium]
MPTRIDKGSGNQNHQRAAEMHNGPAHAHLVAAEAHEKQDHQTGHERSRQAREHSQKAHEHTYPSHQEPADGNVAIAHEDVAMLAHGLWEERGCPDGSPDEDWFNAVQQLQLQGESLQR